MESRYLKWFVLILVVSLLVGIIWNAVLDISNRSQIHHTIRRTFDLVKANKAAEFAEMTKLDCSMIYQDYDQRHLADRVKYTIDLYTTFRGMAELKSVSLLKVLDRTTCLAAITFNDADGKDMTCYMLLLKHEGRAGDTQWLPLRILTIENERKKSLERLRETVDPEKAKEEAKQLALATLAAPATRAEILQTLALNPEMSQELVKVFQAIVGKVEISSLADEVEKAFERAIYDSQDQSPKGHYTALVKRLKAIGESKKPAPDLEKLANRIKEALLDRSRLLPERLKALAKLARKKLQDAEARAKFASKCEEAAGKPDSNPEEFAETYAELASRPVELKSAVADKIPGLISNGATRKYWVELIKAELLKGKISDLDLNQAVEGLLADALDGSDLYEARLKALRDSLQVEKNRRGSVKAKMRKKTELLVRSFPTKWAKMKSREDYMKWAFPEGLPTAGSSGLSESDIKKLTEHQGRFADLVVGKQVEVSITHHWYPDTEGFNSTKTRRTSEIVRARFQTNPGAKEGEEEYEVNDFMLLLEMSPDWSVRWKLYRVCSLYEYAKCRQIAEQEYEKRKVYFADGKVR